MNKKKLLICLSVLMLFAGCEQENESAIKSGSIAFGFTQIIKAAGRVSDESAPAYIKFKLTNAAGEVLDETQEVYQSENHYFMESYSLPIGAYTLEEFIVFNALEEVLYLVPMINSAFADFVSKPLPYSFTVGENTSDIPLEVLSVFDNQPSDFGYVNLEFNVVEIGNFRISASPLAEIASGELEYNILVEAKKDDSDANYNWSKTWSLSSDEVITLPISYDTYRITASANGHLNQVKHFKSGIFHSDLKELFLLGATDIVFELIPTDSDLVLTLTDDEGNKCFVSSDPCIMWARIELNEENVYNIDYFRRYQVGEDSNGKRVGQLTPSGGLVGFPLLMSSLNNVYNWLDHYEIAESYCEAYLFEEYQDQLDDVTLEKGVILDFDYDGTESSLDDYDMHFIHTY